MLYNYFISAWRHLISNKVFSCINILGLASGIAVCILILLFIRKESGYENWVPEAERIVRLHTAYTLPNTPEFLTVRSAGKMKQGMLNYANNHFDAGTHVIPHGVEVQHGGEVFEEEVTFVNQNFFDFFPLPLSTGNFSAALDKPLNLVISETMALKYFGRSNVVGETITVCCLRNETLVLPIVGVARIPENTHLKLDFVVRMNESQVEKIRGILNTWTSVNVHTYFKLSTGTTVDQALDRIHHWTNHESPFLNNMQRHDSLPENAKVTDTVSFKLMPLADLHLQAKDDAGSMGDMTPMGDHKMIRSFSLISALVLVIACINFMNLATARGSRRAKEVALRKTLGATRSQVALQFLGEAMLLVFIATMLALAIVELVLPIYSEAIGEELRFHLFSDASFVASLLIAIVIIGLGAGAYPAVFLSRFKPASVLQSSKGAESRKSAQLRSALVVFQFATSVTLLACTGVIYSQTQFANHVELGFSHDNKLILDISSTRHLQDSLEQQLENLPEVVNVVFSSEAPSQDWENNTFFRRLDAPDIQGVLNYYNVGEGFFQSYNIQAIAGRLFDENFGGDKIDPEFRGDNANPGRANVIVNMRMLKKFGFGSPEDAIGQVLTTDIADIPYQLTIIGVIPDIHFRSIKFGVRDNIYLSNPSRFRVATINYRSDNLPKLMVDIEEIWQQLAPQKPMKLDFLSSMLEAQYRSEQIQAKMFSAFSLLAIVVACLGLYGLISFAAQRRTREIGIRKVMGAQVSDIVRLLVWQFSKPVLVANLLAWPVAWLLMSRWLANFPYRIEVYWVLLICIAASLVCGLIACLTVSLNASFAALARPVEALRHE